MITTLRPLQNSTGGFSGGHGQYSHLATTYAAVLSLVTVGGEALDLVDRRAMYVTPGTHATILSNKSRWQWLGALKQAEGDFEVCVGGERDVRCVLLKRITVACLTNEYSGAYCAMVILSLLNLPTELPQSSPARQYGHTQFHDGLIEWIGKCKFLCTLKYERLIASQVRRMKVDYQVRPDRKLMARTHSARWHVYA